MPAFGTCPSKFLGHARSWDMPPLEDGKNINYLRKGTPVLWRGVPMGKNEEKVQSRCFTTVSSTDLMEIEYKYPEMPRRAFALSCRPTSRVILTLNTSLQVAAGATSTRTYYISGCRGCDARAVGLNSPTCGHLEITTTFAVEHNVRLKTALAR